MKQPALIPEKALKLREHVKRKKPKFIRHEGWRYKRLKPGWRKPRGLDNKMRKKIKGWPQKVNVGYRGPKIARGLHPSGYREILVYKELDLKKINSKTEAVRIAHTVGKRKRAKILSEARKKKITVLNIKEAKEVEEEKELEEEEVKEKEEKEITEKKEVAETKKPKRGKRKRKSVKRGQESDGGS